jgi:hypothetical protein
MQSVFVIQSRLGTVCSLRCLSSTPDYLRNGSALEFNGIDRGEPSPPVLRDISFLDTSGSSIARSPSGFHSASYREGLVAE